MEHYHPSSLEAVALLLKAAYPKTGKKKNLSMSGDPHYQPEDLMPYLGYDQRVSWQILVEWRWLVSLAKFKIMPESCAKLLTKDLLEIMLVKITTTRVKRIETTITKHDVLALLYLMRKYLPKELWPYLHLGLTSYDTICTAYAIQSQEIFSSVFWPKARQVDELWRRHISTYANTLQIGRTHLQDALPITVGFWLSGIHSRFVDSVTQANKLVYHILGKFSGALGTQAAIVTMFGEQDLENQTLKLLHLPSAEISTQIVQSGQTQRFFNEIGLMSEALAKLGNDTRILQSSAIGEVTSVSSTSSTMSHKGANPIAAENIAGMHRSVEGELHKIRLNGNSDLGRDLRDSNVMRSYNAVIVFAYQQLLTSERLLKSFEVDKGRCIQNFWVNGKLVTAELLHLSLQFAGYLQAHSFVNKVIVPLARESGDTLVTEMNKYLYHSRNKKLKIAWSKVPKHVLHILENPDQYTGRAGDMAIIECSNALIRG